MIPTRFNEADAQQAWDVWGVNCGPGAIAAIVGMTLDEVRPFMGDFESKRYTNPTLMLDSLSRIRAAGHIKGWRLDKIGRRVTSVQLPNYGLARVQWEGPWTKPGVPMAARYRHTHWIGAAWRNGAFGVFDINCIKNDSGWVSLQDWRTTLVPWLLKECVPRADGNWHITHAIEIDGATAALIEPPAPLKQGALEL